MAEFEEYAELPRPQKVDFFNLMRFYQPRDLVFWSLIHNTGLFPSGWVQSSPRAYVRLHSRNAGNWYRGDKDRYDYNYSEQELKEWLKKITELADRARRTYLFFNNCHAGQAARNAKLMKELMRQEKLIG